MKALITGGQQGIGLGIAQALHAAGWEIAVASEQATADIPFEATYHQHDVCDIEAIPALLDATGPITTLISNAGVGAIRRGDVLDMTPESFDRCLAVNTRGAVFLAQQVARRMLDMPGDPYRSITFITSVNAAVLSPNRVEYCISKTATAMAAKAFAERLAPENIGVFDIRPGIIQSPMTAPVADRYDTTIPDTVPAGRWGTPRDIADVVVPLARGDFAFATGAQIPVDGGLTIQTF
ncbi:3-ketoacyl-ACP reductase [Jannaschia sp. CCS1]|uniref:3-ketoacyl-ACP reductase n=1 Tax=Jannaschia sp. (strain CCS1) TaxID=290400 RepID=UPI000053BFC9|nr:3-ketoacyl-ACP reductase [Jannaschia sp. CCS1]ABD56847.1 short-chain dehydrogenase/reductase SDR [Jannaschia sp. CCS1]